MKRKELKRNNVGKKNTKGNCSYRKMTIFFLRLIYAFFFCSPLQNNSKFLIYQFIPSFFLFFFSLLISFHLYCDGLLGFPYITNSFCSNAPFLLPMSSHLLFPFPHPSQPSPLLPFLPSFSHHSSS